MRGKIVVVVLVLLGVMLFTDSLFAQAEESRSVAGSRASGVNISWFDTIMTGSGACGFTIIGLSVIAGALMIEHFMTIKRDAIVPPELIGHLESLFEDEEYEEAMTLCESAPNFLTNVIAAGLPKIGQPYVEIEQAMEEAGEKESVKLHQKISYLSLIAQIAPMLGLFGTVQGMIIAFNVIRQSKGAPSPADLAGGIMLALVTTFEGLLVAMPCIAAFFYFRNKVIRIIMEVGEIADELMGRFKPSEETATTPTA